MHYIPVKFHITVNALPEVIKEIKKTNQNKAKHQLLRNTIITDREKVQQGEATVSAHTHMFESRDCVTGRRSSTPRATTGLFFPDFFFKKEGFELIVILLILYYVVSGNYSIGLWFEVFSLCFGKRHNKDE